MELDFTTVLLLILAGFVAAFIDSIVGGGGVISLPAFMALGIPTDLALGTNKLAGTSASFTSTIQYIRSGKVYFPLLKWMFPCALLGSVAGSRVVLMVNPAYLKALVIIVMIAMTLYVILKKEIGLVNGFAGNTVPGIFIGCILAFIIGFYDGFLGPGTGAFLLFLFISFFKFDFIRAAGNGRVINFATNIASLVTFIFYGKVLFLVGLPMAGAMVVGAIFGSRYAIRRGHALIKPLFVLVSTLLMIKLAYDVLYA